MSALLLPLIIWTSLTFVLGIAAGWSLALNQVRHREALRRDLRAEVRDPIDVPFDVVACRAGGA